MQENKIVKRIPTNLVTKTIIISSAEYEPNKEYTDEDANIYEKYLQAITNVSIGINDDIEKIKALEDNILEQYNKNVELANKVKQETEKFAKQANTAIEDYNSNAEAKAEEFNTNVKEKTDEFNSNATEKETEISDIADSFDANVEEKTNTFNSNVETKTTEFNNNSNAKTEEFNNNSTEKINAFNSNAEEKIAEYDAHAEKLTNRIADLEEENSELVEQMPWNITEVQGSIHVDDAAKYSKNKLNVFGNLIQDETVTIPIDIEKSTKNNYISQSGALAGSSITDTTDYIEVKPNKTYTVNLTANDTNFRNLVIFDSNKAVIEAKSYKGNSFSFMTTESACYVRFSYINTAKLTMSTEFDFNYPSMPVVATGVQKIKIVYNILPLDVDEWESGTINGSTGNLENNNARIRMKKYKEIEAKTTYIANLTNNVKVLAIRFFDENYNFISGGYDYNFLSKVISPATAKYYKCVLKNEKSTQISNTYIKDAKIILYKEKEVKENKLDLENTELVKILDANGNVVAQDRPVYREVNGVSKWQWEKLIGKSIIDGTNNNCYSIIQHKTYDQLCCKLGTNNAYIYGYYVKNNIYCNVARGSNYGNISNDNSSSSMADKVAIWNNAGAEIYIANITVKSKLFADLTEINNYLQKNNIVLYYPKKIIEYEDCTDKQAEILDKLYKLTLQKGTNNILVESENGVTTELQLEYMQDNNLKKEQENKALEDRITAIENLLSTTETSALLLDNMQNDLESEVE